MLPSAPTPRITRYTDWLRRERGLEFATYEALWTWSVSDLEAFWRSIWDYHDIESPAPPGQVLDRRVMPGARWFAGTELNFARQLLRHADAAHAAGQPALVFQGETMAEPISVAWPELRRRVAALAASLQQMGVKRGDRVGAYLANRPETLVAYLACASLGAVWSVCSPDMGPVAVLDRFRQIEPVLLIATDHQHWGGLRHDRRAVLAEVVAGLPSLRHLVMTGGEAVASGLPTHDFAALCAQPDARFTPEWLPFDHPLWIVYSSGTTGLPKPIVHGHGGVMLEFLKAGLHNDVAPSAEVLADGSPSGERFHWFTTTGWIMWNAQLGALLGGTTVCLYDGNPGGPAARPDWGTLWRFVSAAGVSWFGAGAAFFASCLKADVEPMREADLSRLRAAGSTGSPLSEDAYRWIWDRLPRPDGERIWINPISGGTDFAGAFVGGLRTLPVIEGQMQVRCLGAAVQAWGEPDAQGLGQPLTDEVGELVCTEPMPSMPLYLWGDADGARYRASYFDMYRHADGRPVWRHGDWIRLIPQRAGDGVTPSHTSAVIYGRSDATINRHGVRMGTAELYRAVEAEPEVLDSLVVDLEYLGRPSWMPLFVVLRDGVALDAALEARLRAAIRQALSPRHVPDTMHQVAAIPRTLSGKKMELPVKKLLQGETPAKVLNRDAMANAASIDWFVAFARERSGSGTAG